MHDGPGGNVRRCVKQIFNKAQILLFALDARTKSSRTRLFQLFPKVITTLEPLFAPCCPLLLCVCRLSRNRQPQKQQVGQPPLSNEGANVLICGLVLHCVSGWKAQSTG